MKRWFVFGFLLLACVEAAYCTATYWLLGKRALLPFINTDPEELLVSFQSGHSWIPCKVHFENLTIRVQDSNIQLYIRLPRASLTVNPLALFTERLHVTSLTGDQLSFWLRFRKTAKELRPLPPGALPPIPGLVALKKVETSQLPSPPPWKIRVDNIHLPLRELWVEQYKVETQGKVKGGFYLWPGSRALEISHAHVSLQGGSVFNVLRPIARIEQATIDLGLDKVIPSAIRGNKNVGVLESAKAKVNIAAHVTSLRFLNIYWLQAPWFRLEKGQGHVAGKLTFDHGKLGGNLSVPDATFDAHLWQHKLNGLSDITWKADDKTGKFGLRIKRFALFPFGSKSPGVTGNDFSISLQSSDLSLEHFFYDTEAVLKLSNASFSNLKFGNRYLPRSSGVTVRGGHGTLSGSLTINTKSGDKGEATLAARDMQVQVNKLGIKGDLNGTVRIPSGNIAQGQINLSGTEFHFEEALQKQPNEKAKKVVWWGTVALPEARFDSGSDLGPEIVAKVDVNAEDSRLLSQWVPGIPGFVQNLFAVPNFKLTTHIAANGKRIRIDDLYAHGGKATTVQGWLSKAGPQQDGLFLVQIEPIAVGIGFRANQPRIRLENAIRWYHRKMGGRRAAKRDPAGKS